MRVPGGKFADKVGGQKVCIGALVVAISCALMNLNLPWFGTFLITIVIAVAFGFNNAAVMKLVPVYVAKSVGGASGWVGGLGAFGGFVFPIRCRYRLRQRRLRSRFPCLHSLCNCKHRA